MHRHLKPWHSSSGLWLPLLAVFLGWNQPQLWVSVAGSAPTPTQLDRLVSCENAGSFFEGGAENVPCWQFCALMKYGIAALPLPPLWRANKMPRRGGDSSKSYTSCNWRRFNLQRLRWTLEQKFHTNDVYEITERNLENCFLSTEGNNSTL